MSIVIEEFGDSIAKVVLAGRLDVLGADPIALPLATLAGARPGIVLDMAGVSFIASIALRHFVVAAKTLARRGGRIVLLNPTAPVTEVLEVSGFTALLPVARSEAEARAAVTKASAS